MTPEERAEKIRKFLQCDADGNSPLEKDVNKFIAAQIQEAELNAKAQSIAMRAKEAKFNYQRGFNAAKKKAAEIAERHSALTDKEGVFSICEEIAYRIRKMEAE